MKINGMDINFSFTNIDDAARFEIAIKNMEENEKKVKEVVEYIEKGQAGLTHLMKAQMMMFKEFFKDCVGEDVLSDCRDLKEAKTTYLSFIEELNNQTKDYLKDKINYSATAKPVAENIKPIMRSQMDEEKNKFLAMLSNV